MPLTVGSRIGPYEVIALLGEGGMGQVYRARDTKLDRDVAIKVLPDGFVADPERVARFQREAKTLASLSHPNIAIIHGLEQAGDVHALVMELVDGEDLSQRIARGKIPIEDALPIAKQIAEALEAAHEQGVVHRDLKPANIKVRADGTVKVLDFGLAKAIDAAGSAAGSGSASVSMSPTITTPAMTLAGVILGTAAYMSPEQAKGRAADKRSDVWSFGCVLYEMLSGVRTFEGEDVSDTLAAVLRATPDWSALPPTVPPSIARLIRGCLQRDRRERVPDIAVARFEIRDAMASPSASDSALASPPPMAARPLWTRAIPVAVAAIVAGAAVGALVWIIRTPPALPGAPVSRFVIPLGEGQAFTATNSQSIAVSPDGTRIVYAANSQLYVRAIADLDARPIPGTQQSPTVVAPTFSPDGQSIAFYSQQDQAIKRVALTGGAAVTVCPWDGPLLGMNWDESGILIGRSGKGILRVPERGGVLEVILPSAGDEFLQGPQMLPGGEWILFSRATSATIDGWDKAQILVQSLKSKERKTLVTGGSDARYVPSGHIIYALGGVEFAVPFDLTRLTVTGGAVPVVEGVRRSTGTTGITHLNVSRTGTLVFAPGSATTTSAQMVLALIDRSGGVQPFKVPTAAYEYPRLSADGKWIALDTDNGKEANIWIYDVSAATSLRKLTLSGRDRVPVWSPDSVHVAFQSDRDGDLAIWMQRADGSAPAERLTKPEKGMEHVPTSWSPDGKTLLFSESKGGSFTVQTLSLADRKVAPFGGIKASLPPSAAFSADGQWVAYSAGLFGSAAGSLMVQPFPATGAIYPVSKGNGIHAMWSHSGKELFYGPAAAQLAIVPVTMRPTFAFGNVETVTRVFQDRGPSGERNADLTLDDKQVIGVVNAGQTTGSSASSLQQMQVVLNWFDELKTRAPAGK